MWSDARRPWCCKSCLVMSHIIRELLEPAGLNSWSQQASAAQGYNDLFCKWVPLLWGAFLHVSLSECCAQVALLTEEAALEKVLIWCVVICGYTAHVKIILSAWSVALLDAESHSIYSSGWSFKKLMVFHFFLPFVRYLLFSLMTVNHPFLSHDKAPRCFHLAVFGGVGKGTAGD